MSFSYGDMHDLLAMFVVGSVPYLLLSSLLQQTFCQIVKAHVGMLVKI